MRIKNWFQICLLKNKIGSGSRGYKMGIRILGPKHIFRNFFMLPDFISKIGSDSQTCANCPTDSFFPNSHILTGVKKK